MLKPPGRSQIDVVYGNVTNGGASATIGVQDGAGHNTQFACNAGGLSTGEVVTFFAGNRPCAPDINHDGQVNVADFLAFLSAYSAGNPVADITADGQINVADFLAFLSAYSAGCA